MRVNDLFYLLDKRILIFDSLSALGNESRRQFALSGASVIGPLSRTEDVLLAVPLHHPDAVIIEVSAEASDIVEIARLLDGLSIPYLFASISSKEGDYVSEGFHLNGDVEELRKIIQALFRPPPNEELH